MTLSPLDTRIELEHVCVDLVIHNALSRSFKHSLLRSAVGGKIDFGSSQIVIHALDDINLSLRPGDRLGLTGHNGAGKTTLLRVLAGAYPPTRGRAVIQGRVISFLDIMLGMDVEYSGLENIFIRGLLYGISRKEMRLRVDEIVDFSGLESFINLPMRTYSSGMMMRLAFSIATSIEADIILMDEWLSVGDKDFASKAQDRLSNYLKKVDIMVLASHSETLIQDICNKRVELSGGKIVSAEGKEK